MSKIILIIAIACILAAAGCEEDLAYKENLNAIPIIIDKDLYDKNIVMPQDTLSIEEAVTEADILKMTVLFTGGCEKHTFSLITTGDIDKSNPPKAHFILTHDAKGDTCTESIREDLRFDLKPFKKYLQQRDTTAIYLTIELAGLNQQPPFTQRLLLFYEF